MKDEIVRYILHCGFTQNGNQFTKNIHKQTGVCIVNGQKSVEYNDIIVTLEYIGDGWEGKSENDSVPLTQWRYSINGTPQTEFLIHDLEEFKKTFK